MRERTVESSPAREHDAERVLRPHGELAARMAADPRLADRIVARPHPLLVTVRKDQLFAVIAPAAVWDRGREVLRPFSQRFAEGEALLRRAHALGAPLGRFQLEAAIQSVHCDRARTGVLDRDVLVDLYRGLVAIAPTAGALEALAALGG